MQVESFAGQFNIFVSKGSPKDYYNLDDSICDFLLYYKDRLHSTTNVAPYKASMDANEKELMGK